MDVAGKKMLRRVVVSSVVGATIEWYDFFLYGVLAGIVLNKLYFPADQPLVSTLLSYATFAVGFVARPVGGLVIGHFGDKLGRKKMLLFTLLLMGTSTVCMGLVPTYDQIGLAAPALLLLLRVLQGFGLGGEWGGAVLMTYEFAEPARRGYFASLPQVGLSIGLCLASGVVGLLSWGLTEAQFLAWGWRIGFLLSVVLLFLGSWIRNNVNETPEFARVMARRRRGAPALPLAAIWRESRGLVLAGLGARFIDGVFFNIFAVFSITFLTGTLHVDKTVALLGVMAASLVLMACLPVAGRLSDRYGRPRVFMLGCVCTGLSAFPAFWLMMAGPDNPVCVFAALVIPLGVFHALVYGPIAALFADMFRAEVRYTGISFVYQVSGVYAAGITPMIATALLGLGDDGPYFVAGYVLLAGVVSFLSTWWIGRHPAGAAAPVVLGAARAET
ncbi:MAG: MFS transporter [Solidesulfovibrio sp. DCME]|uniref:MFS transporter n=1 Tax=Solidesulfovibrio sp. DCME TaxID=3447380 RepID=UPI003D0BC6DF